MLRLIEYKKQYGISLAAMIYRAQQENILPSGIYKMLWCEFAKRGWRKNEPGDVGPDRPVRFEQMLEGAIRTGVLTWAKATAITRIRETELRERLAKAVKMWLLNSEERKRDL
jgi:Zn-dependent peptidase ImmA (M78 family)